jgi:succinate dehydrogenase hydrophobic anchor subunit
MSLTGYLWLRLTGFLLLGLVAAHIAEEFIFNRILEDVRSGILSFGITVFVLITIIHAMVGWQRVVDDLGIAARSRRLLLGLHIVVGALLLVGALVVLVRVGRL